ncbi:MAG: class I SAM-dependent methyltransferase [Cyanobacteriota bacterium]
MVIPHTIKLLSTIKPGTHLPDDIPCFDKAEIEELATILGSLVYAPSSLRKLLQEKGITITPSDFYSEVPTVAEIESSFAKSSKLKLDRIFHDHLFLLESLHKLDYYADEFKAPLASQDPTRYAWEGCAFSYSDAMAYYCMIRLKQPKKIIEIGSGASTLVARQALEKNGFGTIVAVEPFPLSCLNAIADVELITERAQDLDSSFFNDHLSDGDILFIDSTHTVKHDSDVLHIYLRVLPELNRSITIHAHDIYLPESLPLNLLRDHQIYWTEQYLLYAYMLNNPRVRTLFGSRYHMLNHHAELTRFMRNQYQPGGASLWFEQTKLIAVETPD